MVNVLNNSNGFLFVHFTGTEDTEKSEQLYFSLSNDGLNWKDCNAGNPILTSNIGEKGIRDPFIIRHNDGSGFTILATDLSIYHRGGWDKTQTTYDGSKHFVVWNSSDLLHWTAPRLVRVVKNDIGCAWAPEAIFDPENNCYFVYWSSPSNDEKHKMHILGSYTKDFETFSTPKTYIENEKTDLIDTSIIRFKNQFIRASRGEKLILEKSNSLHSKWTPISSVQDLKLGISGDTVEGPEFVKINDNRWILYVDQFYNNQGYLPIITHNLTSPDPADWHVADSYNFGKTKKRHGSIINLTKAEYSRLASKLL
jgi:sucrose-6-phosphate hydrolase SacC (GH32 family)